MAEDDFQLSALASRDAAEQALKHPPIITAEEQEMLDRLTEKGIVEWKDRKVHRRSDSGRC